jgi:hypothetical protein
VKEGAEAKNARRLRITARNAQRNHGATTEAAAYLADVDLETVEGKAQMRAQNREVRTGVALEARPEISDVGVVVDFRWVDARAEGAPDTLATFGSAKLQFPRIRRRSFEGQLLVPNTGTAFAGAEALAEKPGWHLAVFLRPQIDAKAPKEAFEPKGDLRLEVIPLQGLTSLPLLAADGDAESRRYTSDDLMALLIESVEKESWDESAGTTAYSNNGFAFVRNTPAVLKKVRAFFADMAARELAPVAIDLRIVRARQEVVGAEEALTARGLEKLLARAAEGKGASVVWQGSGVSAGGAPFRMADESRRSYVHDCFVVSGEPDPEVRLLEWGVRAEGCASYDAKENRIHVHALKVDWSSLVDLPTAAHPAGKGAVVHQPKLAGHSWKSAPTLEPGAWHAVGIGALNEECLVLLVRARR